MSELAKGLLDAKGAPRDLVAAARAAATMLVGAGVDPASIDIVAEHLARLAELLGNETLTYQQLVDAVSHTAPPEQLLTTLEPAFAQPLGKAALAALALHLVDIGEIMAFAVYAPELPNISAKADRSGGAARSAGVAKRLRG
ncbi:MAG: hypothetical protein ACAI38_03450 [Myxococcota bacterium]|nr:hypothetical protein [Myxococcota bacterium]